MLEAYAAAAQAKEVNGVEVVLDGMYAGYGDAPRALATPRRGDAGTQFACGTSTKVQILTKMLQRCHLPPTRIWSNSKRMC